MIAAADRDKRDECTRCLGTGTVARSEGARILAPHGKARVVCPECAGWVPSKGLCRSCDGQPARDTIAFRVARGELTLTQAFAELDKLDGRVVSSLESTEVAD